MLAAAFSPCRRYDAFFRYAPTLRRYRFILMLIATIIDYATPYAFSLFDCRFFIFFDARHVITPLICCLMPDAVMLVCYDVDYVVYYCY